ncbi:hypothetical protein M441DRAFT_62888 [Trichoderma asperellum CBS 433.97]|uniref:Carrier domain-containing protein n=1 Tax=Trichoderma asperellum (strain ATCC 204424 / CBS 433.97 / NBRC 101777) TaxID=1042311 RepID=A0A2T3YRS8_TRIA4|nr:hypothetical protein M441DRAFT_62888 [Trichoderma asperellum CBS 433.97]PTB35262.1 hypothetical protein M441DRAFT_62888 [Trichoderma asperellum CBS 433.97]
MEEQLRQIWADVLFLEPDEIETDDNLFELGGDSIKAIRIIGRAADHGLYFDIATLYANPTIGSLAAVVDGPEASSSRQKIGICKGISASDDLLQRVRLRIEDLGIPQSQAVRAAKLREDQVEFVEMTAKGAIGASSAFIYEVHGIDVVGKLQQAIEALTAKNPVLRTTFVDLDGTYYQVLLAEARPKLLVQSGRVQQFTQEASMRVLAAGDATAHYALVDDGGTSFLVFSIFHGFFDGFSRALVEQDLVAALESPDSFAQQAERPWYGDFARRLDAELDDASARAFWRQYLEGAHVATIHRGPPGAPRRFDQSLYETVAADVLKGGQIHLASAITAAWALALMRRSGATDIAFTILTLGRLYPYEGIDRLPGLLVKDRPFRLRVQDRAATVESVLRAVQQDLVSAGEFEHSTPFRDRDRRPLLQSYVNIKLGASAMEPTRVDGLTLAPRRDLERWESESQYAIYLEMKPLAGANRFEMRYHSALIGDAQAAALLRDFVELLRRLGSCGGSIAVATLLESVGSQQPMDLRQ